MEKTTFGQLSQREQDELASILQAHRQGRSGDSTLANRFHSTFQDAFTWWLFLLLAAACGAGFLIYNMNDTVRYLLPEDSRNVRGALIWLARSGELWLLLLCLAFGVWVALIVARNYKRRGYAATSFALIRIRANKLALVNHVNVVAIDWAHEGSLGKTYSVLDLKPKEGKTLRLYPSTRWVEVALEQLIKARAAAGLPQIEPTVTWGIHYRRIERPAPAADK
jgi:hypothetical protein